MNAQEAWKHLYQGWKQAPIYTLGGNYPKYCERGALKDIRREAALERKLEAAQRTIEEQAAELNHYRRLQADIDMDVIELVMPGEVAEVIDPDELRLP